MNIDVFWSLVQSNADHIKTLNYEMGAVQASIESIQCLNVWMLGCMSATFVAVLIGLIASTKSLRLIKKNGKG